MSNTHESLTEQKEEMFQAYPQLLIKWQPWFRCYQTFPSNMKPMYTVQARTKRTIQTWNTQWTCQLGWGYWSKCPGKEKMGEQKQKHWGVWEKAKVNELSWQKKNKKHHKNAFYACKNSFKGCFCTRNQCQCRSPTCTQCFGRLGFFFGQKVKRNL